MDMKRDILFRGKDLENGEWVYGYLIRVRYYLDEEKIRSIIIPVETALYPRGEIGCLAFVNPETVGQFTGLVDKNGTKIFEGDIVNIEEHEHMVNGYYRVFYDEKSYGYALQRDIEYHYNYFSFSELNGFAETSEVIGNIHDNPELLKEAANE